MFRPTKQGGNNMKRLIFVVCALVVLLGQNVALPQTAVAAGAIKSLDSNALIGMTTSALTKKYGSPNRKEPSEYGFTWYVYNKDYKNFFMAGIRDGKVVADYTNAKTLNYKNQFKLGSTKATVRKKLGKTVSYVRSGNTIYVLPNPDQRDTFKVGSNFVIVFYDNKKGGKVTSIMIVPQADETDALINRPELDSDLVAAYQRISVDLINAIRVRSGLKKLTSDSLDTKLAVSRSKDMRDRDYFDHFTPAPDRLSPADQARKMGIRFSSLGENIAYGDHNAILAHEAFMNSSDHRSNVLRASYKKVGAGVAYGSNRYVLLTNIFTK
jgi:uncharacterized protein YkwD